MSRRIVCLGAGGHARSVLDAAQAAGFEVLGVLDRPNAGGPARCGAWPVVGDDDRLPEMIAAGIAVVVGVGGTGDNAPRRRLFERWAGAGADLPAVVHARAYVSTDARIGRGTVVLAGAIVNAGARIGENVIVNTGAVVEHDCRLGDHVHVAPGAVLGGAVAVAEGAHVGLGAVVREGCRIAGEAVIGAGAVVVGDVPAGAVWTGVPARPRPR